MMMLVRLWHHYIGFLIAPSVLFFAFTGSLQLFSLHEAHGDYTPPALIEKLASVHKDQVFRSKPRRAAPPARQGGEDGAPPNAVAATNAAGAPPAAVPQRRSYGDDDDAPPNAVAATNAAGAPPAAVPHRRSHDDDDDDDAGPPPAASDAGPPAPAALAAATNAAVPPSNAAASIRPASPNAAPPAAERGPKLGTTLLKWWFLAVALGLITSTCLGLWIGFNHVRRRTVAAALFAIGAVVPVVLLLI